MSATAPPTLATLATAPEPERARLVVLLSAWWTLAAMESTGVDFDAFVREAAAGNDAVRPLWDELTQRLHRLALEELEAHPEAVLSPEVRALVEHVVATMAAQPAAEVA